MSTSISQADSAKAETKPTALDAQNALDFCRQCANALHFICEPDGGMLSEERNDALLITTSMLYEQLQIVRDHFEMDKKEAAS
jgi:hypothetical protein